MTISCIICAYNEEKYIEGVLRVATTFPDFTEVIVVNDGSTDSTEEVIQRHPSIKYVRHEHNQGKAKAVQTGLKHATGDLIVLLDADLLDLHHKNLKQLIEPHYTSRCMTLSLRGNSWFYLLFCGIDPWTGERCLPKDLMEQVDFKSAHGYLIEAMINDMALKQGLPVISVNWPNVWYVPKAKKLNSISEGTKEEIKMITRIFTKFGIFKTTFQLGFMALLGFRQQLLGMKFI